MASTSSLLNITDLNVTFTQRIGWQTQRLRALRNINLHLERGKILAIVGESGCGKTTLAKCIAGLLAPTSGSIELPSSGQRVQYVFQDPFASLNPGMTVEQIVLEPLNYLTPKPDRQTQLAKLESIFAEVGLDYEQRQRYPHEFSGGQCQRIAIARALIAEPVLLISDEPVSALDVSVKAQVINLLRKLNQQRGLSQIFIAHDLWLARYLSDDIVVLYQGQVMEAGQCAAIFNRPSHPYTRDLIDAIPVADPAQAKQGHQHTKPLTTIATSGCAYAPRCERRQPNCLQQIPELQQTARGTQVACFYPMVQ